MPRRHSQACLHCGKNTPVPNAIPKSIIKMLQAAINTGHGSEIFPFRISFRGGLSTTLSNARSLAVRSTAIIVRLLFHGSLAHQGRAAITPAKTASSPPLVLECTRYRYREGNLETTY